MLKDENCEKCMAEEKKETDESTIYVGNKPPMSYVLAVVTEFNRSNADEVVIKARGRAISTAVDTAEIVRHRFITDADVKKINIGTEKLPRVDDRASNVSMIEIHLAIKKRDKQ